MSIIATWAFSESGVRAAAECLGRTNDALAAVETGISVVEHDPVVTSVGYGGLPNATGNLQLDAAIMTSTGRMGSVMALSGFRTAIPAACAVLKHSPHPLVTGSTATAFATRAMGPVKNQKGLLTAHAGMRYAQFAAGQISSAAHGDENTMAHTDTVGMIARDQAGLLVAGCATSGMQFKMDGRVGDSPIFGAGLYADACGAAVASGDGDRMLRFCLSFLVVERMRMGEDVQQACRYAVDRVKQAEPRCQAAVAAMSSQGELGASCTHGGFTAVTWTGGEVEKRPVDGAGQEKWAHSCV